MDLAPIGAITSGLRGAAAPLGDLLARGGPAMAAIGLLSVAMLTITLWKLWRLARGGVFARARAEAALAAWKSGRRDAARAAAAAVPGPRGVVLATAFDAVGTLPEPAARAETTRVARAELAEAGAGLRALELIALVAPLLGLLGTVLGMIAAFRALEAGAGAADPAALAGGIWEALLTTAAGMAVAIPASLALGFFESVTEGLRRDLEDMATRVFVAGAGDAAVARAAE